MHVHQIEDRRIWVIEVPAQYVIDTDYLDDPMRLWERHHRQWLAEAGLPQEMHFVAGSVDLQQFCLVFRVTDQLESSVLTSTCLPMAGWFCA